MDNSSEVRDFLTSRRARISPEQAGLPTYRGKRRVPGLRREEVSLLSGVSADYYTRLERGDLSGVSESVLDAVCRALQLDEAERTHLFDLARTAGPTGRPHPTRSRRGLRPGVQRILDSMSTTPAYVRNGRFDIPGANRLGQALFADLYDGEKPGLNLARYLFLDPRSRDFYVEWDRVARDCAQALRIEAGRDPYDRALTDLVGELSTRSEEFRQWWAAHDVKLHRTATKRMHHPVVGDIELTGEALELPGDTGLTIITYTVEPDSDSSHALAFLASWSSERLPAASAEATADTDADTC